MAHRRTVGGRGGEHSEVRDNFALLVFGDSRKPLEYERVFLELPPRNFYPCTQTTSGESQTEQQGTDGETAYSLHVRVAAEAHSRVSVANLRRKSRVMPKRGMPNAGRKMRLIPLLQRPA